MIHSSLLAFFGDRRILFFAFIRLVGDGEVFGGDGLHGDIPNVNLPCHDRGNQAIFIFDILLNYFLILFYDKINIRAFFIKIFNNIMLNNDSCEIREKR